MKSYLDIIWYLIFGLFLFCFGVTYQWHFGQRPASSFAIFDTPLDGAKDSVSETLRLLGMKKPDYFYPTTMTADDNFVNIASAQQGLTLVTGVNDKSRLEAKVVGLDGDVVQYWDLNWFEIWPDAEHVPDIFVPKQMPGTHIHGATVMDNGDLVFNYENQGLVRLDVCGGVVWRLPYLTHHSIYLDPDSGHLWVSGKIFHEKPAAHLPNHRPPFAEETAIEVSPEGKILTEISLLQVLSKNGLEGLTMMSEFNEVIKHDVTTTGDTLHLNDVEVFPSHLPAGHFRPGDIMVSLRNIHSVIVFDPKSYNLRFIKTGAFVGQHDPDFVDGNTISVFDNHLTYEPGVPQQSRIMMFNASEGTSEVYYQGTESQPFYTFIMGKKQWLQNGNLLMTESTKGRAFEIDRDGEIVWQYLNLVEDGKLAGLISEAQRLPSTFDRSFFDKQRERCASSS